MWGCWGGGQREPTGTHPLHLKGISSCVDPECLVLQAQRALPPVLQVQLACQWPKGASCAAVRCTVLTHEGADPCRALSHPPHAGCGGRRRGRSGRSGGGAQGAALPGAQAQEEGGGLNIPNFGGGAALIARGADRSWAAGGRPRAQPLPGHAQHAEHAGHPSRHGQSITVTHLFSTLLASPNFHAQPPISVAAAHRHQLSRSAQLFFFSCRTFAAAAAQVALAVPRAFPAPLFACRLSISSQLPQSECVTVVCDVSTADGVTSTRE